MILDLVKITIELQRELRQPMTVFMLDQIYDKCRARVWVEQHLIRKPALPTSLPRAARGPRLRRQQCGRHHLLLHIRPRCHRHTEALQP